MSEQPQTAELPRWDLADRLRKALRTSDVSVQEMADYLDVDRSSVSNWLGGRVDPSSQTVMLWALRTGVPYTWFCHGSLTPCDIAPLPEDVSRRHTTKMHKLPTGVVA